MTDLEFYCLLFAPTIMVATLYLCYAAVECAR